MLLPYSLPCSLLFLSFWLDLSTQRRQHDTTMIDTTTATTRLDGLSAQWLPVSLLRTLLKNCDLTYTTAVLALIAITLFAIAMKRRRRRRYLVTVPQQHAANKPAGQQSFFGNGATPWGGPPSQQYPMQNQPPYDSAPAPPPYNPADAGAGYKAVSRLLRHLNLLSQFVSQPEGPPPATSGYNSYAAVGLRL